MTRTKEQQEQVREVENNYEAFSARKFPPRLSGKHVVLRSGKVVKYADTSSEAYAWGMRRYKDERFSIQQIDAKPLYFSGFELGKTGSTYG